MDVVTHGLVGGLVACAVSGRVAWPVLAAVVGGAVLPDIDVVARLWDPVAAITVHRTATHSVIGGLPLAAGVAAALRLTSARATFGRLAGLAYLGVLSHIALDLVTPFGTAALWPLDARRLSLPWLYVIDAVVVGHALVGLLAATRSPRLRTSGPRAALALLVVYVLGAGVASRTAEAEFRQRLDGQGVAPLRTVLTPVFPGPVRWLGVAETPDTLYRVRFWLGRPSAAPIEVLARGVPPPASALEQRPEVRAFRAFARVPWLRAWADGDRQVVEYRDLAFEDHPLGGPMALRFELDHSGTVRTVALGHRL